jgi:hypothetical protein
MLEAQYKRVLKSAFPKLTFKGITWNWGDVYGNEDCFANPVFMRIHTAFKNAAKRRGHPFYKFHGVII